MNIYMGVPAEESDHNEVAVHDTREWHEKYPAVQLILPLFYVIGIALIIAFSPVLLLAWIFRELWNSTTEDMDEEEKENCGYCIAFPVWALITGLTCWGISVACNAPREWANKQSGFGS